MTSMARRLFAAALWLLSSAALAQDTEIRGAPPGQFDFFVLALSWSPGFCEIASDAGRRDQCQAGSGQRFVVHGLWPQNERNYPVFCRPEGRFISSMVTAESRGLFPEDGLGRYQWRKHGACSGVSPGEYFRLVRAARDKVNIPEAFAKTAVDTKVLPLEIERAFVAVNPGLRTDMMAVSCKRRVLDEIRICLDRDLRNFRQCPTIDRDGCHAGEIIVPAVR